MASTSQVANTLSTPEVVVVTGASAGVGRATVRAFARRGTHIGLIARGHEGLEDARSEVEAFRSRGPIVVRSTPSKASSIPCGANSSMMGAGCA